MRMQASVIECPGRVRDASFLALEISVEEFVSPLHLIFALPVVTADALAKQMNPRALYDEIARRINSCH
jgi:hypothetical protein